MSDLEAANPYQVSNVASTGSDRTSERVLLSTGSFAVAAIIALGSTSVGWWDWIAAGVFPPGGSADWLLLASTGIVTIAFILMGIAVKRRNQQLTLICLGPIAAAILYLISVLAF